MSSYVYCLYATDDGVPRYVSRAADKVSYRFKQHVTAALEKEPGALYDWMRDVWRREADVAVYTLQEGVIPKDEAMFEQYWIDQFADLLNILGNKGRRATHGKTGKQVVSAIQAQLEQARQAQLGFHRSSGHIN